MSNAFSKIMKNASELFNSPSSLTKNKKTSNIKVIGIIPLTTSRIVCIVFSAGSFRENKGKTP